eukprot:Hpha_TRINITY_DN15310_c1_g8::TRINITY_DN15310_c1_g8_i1::g.91330::m.91330
MRGTQFALLETFLYVFLFLFIGTEVSDLQEMWHKGQTDWELQQESRTTTRTAETWARGLARGARRALSSFGRHLLQSWNAMDYCVIALLALALWKRKLLGDAEAATLDRASRAEGAAEYVSFGALSVTTRSLRDLLGGLIAVAWVKSLKYMVILPVVGPTVDAIVETIINTNILGFCSLFLVVSTSLSLGLHFTLGNNSEEFSSPSAAGLAFFRMVFGDFNASDFTAHKSVMGELLFVTCLVTANFVLLNILMAVIGHEYDERLKVHQREWRERMIGAYESTLRGGDAGFWMPGRKAPRVHHTELHYVIEKAIVAALQREREPAADFQHVLDAVGDVGGKVRNLREECTQAFTDRKETASGVGDVMTLDLTRLQTERSSLPHRTNLRSSRGTGGAAVVPKLLVAAPTRWQMDRKCDECNLCSAEFSLSRRRHHCRGCGLIFCAQCSAQKARSGKRTVRVCDNCYAISLGSPGA